MVMRFHSPWRSIVRWCAVAAITGCGGDCDKATGPNPQEGRGYISLLQVDEEQLRLHIFSNEFRLKTGQPTITINDQPLTYVSRLSNEIVAEIPSSGPNSYGQVVVTFPSGEGYTRYLPIWSGTVQAQFHKDGLTSSGSYRIRFRGSLPDSVHQRLTVSAMRESVLLNWDVGGFNPQVRSRTKSCAGSSTWYPAEAPFTGSGFWAVLEITWLGRNEGVPSYSALLFGTGTVSGCVLQEFVDGSTMTTGVGWPFLQVLRAVNESGPTIPAGNASNSDYSTSWSAFVAQ